MPMQDALAHLIPASFLLQELLFTYANEMLMVVLMDSNALRAMFEDAEGISDAVAAIPAAWTAAVAAEPGGGCKLWEFLLTQWPRVRKPGLAPLPPLSEEERQLALSFCAGCGAPAATKQHVAG